MAVESRSIIMNCLPFSDVPAYEPHEDNDDNSLITEGIDPVSEGGWACTDSQNAEFQATCQEYFDNKECDRKAAELNMEEQRHIVAGEKWRNHVRWFDRLSAGQRLSLDNRVVALKILLNEAFARDIAACRKQTRWTAEEERQLRDEWNAVAARVQRDMENEDNSGLVLRNLSCMCVFISQSVSREYGENMAARHRRLEKMQRGLQDLQAHGVLFHADIPTMTQTPTQESSPPFLSSSGDSVDQLDDSVR